MYEGSARDVCWKGHMSIETGVSVVVLSKDEPGLANTLERLQLCAERSRNNVECIVVDASEGRLDAIRRSYPWVRWIDFDAPRQTRITIPHQRNVGVRAATHDVVAFVDATFLPEPPWPDSLIAPILDREETVTAAYYGPPPGERLFAVPQDRYLDEAATGNLAFTVAAFDSVGGFDERFEYGSDIDFSWRLLDEGHRLRNVPEAQMLAPHGSLDPRELRVMFKRSFRYGKARARLYGKHPARRLPAVRKDPIVPAYALFLLGLPLTLRYRAYPLLLALPLWRNRSSRPAHVVASHLAFGAGVLTETARMLRRRRVFP